MMIFLFFYDQNILKGRDDSHILYSEEKLMTGEHKPESDYFFVACSKFSWLPNVYTMYHAYVQRDPQVREFEVTMPLAFSLLREAYFSCYRMTRNWVWLLWVWIRFHG